MNDYDIKKLVEALSPVKARRWSDYGLDRVYVNATKAFALAGLNDDDWDDLKFHYDLDAEEWKLTGHIATDATLIATFNSFPGVAELIGSDTDGEVVRVAQLTPRPALQTAPKSIKTVTDPYPRPTLFRLERSFDHEAAAKVAGREIQVAEVLEWFDRAVSDVRAENVEVIIDTDWVKMFGRGGKSDPVAYTEIEAGVLSFTVGQPRAVEVLHKCFKNNGLHLVSKGDRSILVGFFLKRPDATDGYVPTIS